MVTLGIVLAFYGYSAMKNPNVWGDQGRDEIKPENWNGYVVHNGQFMMYAGFFLAALAAGCRAVADLVCAAGTADIDWVAVVCPLAGALPGRGKRCAAGPGAGADFAELGCAGAKSAQLG